MLVGSQTRLLMAEHFAAWREALHQIVKERKRQEVAEEMQVMLRSVYGSLARAKPDLRGIDRNIPDDLDLDEHPHIEDDDLKLAKLPAAAKSEDQSSRARRAP